MHILLIGSRGQLGRAVSAAFAARHTYQLTLWSRPEYDIADPSLGAKVAALHPDVVINAAAWTDVDGAEANPAAAYAANALGPKYLAEGCAYCGAALVQLSTNEVSAGTPGRVYYEYDQPAPGSVYARSKYAGEQAARQMLDRLYIVRVAWLFGVGGNNFPSKIITAADKRGALNVVDDEIGNPTYAPDVAAALIPLLATERYGMYHLVNEGSASRFTLAQTVLQATGRGHVPLTPVPHTAWPRPAQPPLHAVLVNQAAAALGITLRPWQEAVQAYVHDHKSSPRNNL
jgi:dTDP-4-dehydrorhamnose reductase